MRAVNPFKEYQGLRVVAYAGDNKILLAMTLDESAINETDKNLAGFAIWRTSAGKEQSLGNRISFAPAAAVAPADQPKWTDSDKAPFQKFRWVDVPPDGFGAQRRSYRAARAFRRAHSIGRDACNQIAVTTSERQAIPRHSRLCAWESCEVRHQAAEAGALATDRQLVENSGHRCRYCPKHFCWCNQDRARRFRDHQKWCPL